MSVITQARVMDFECLSSSLPRLLVCQTCNVWVLENAKSGGYTSLVDLAVRTSEPVIVGCLLLTLNRHKGAPPRLGRGAFLVPV